jgi:hypothetical protein
MTKRRRRKRVILLLLVLLAGLGFLAYRHRPTVIGEPAFIVIYTTDTAGYLEDCG